MSDFPEHAREALEPRVHYTDAQRLTIALAELASALGVQLTRNDALSPDWRVVDRLTAHVRRAASEAEALDDLRKSGAVHEPPLATAAEYAALAARVAALEARPGNESIQALASRTRDLDTRLKDVENPRDERTAP